MEAALVACGAAEVGAWVEVIRPLDGWSSHRTWGVEKGAGIAVGDVCRVSRFAPKGQLAPGAPSGGATPSHGTVRGSPRA